MSGDDDIIHIHDRGNAFAHLAEIAAKTDAEAVLAAAEAWERARADEGEMTGDHMADLFAALVRLRGPFTLKLEAEVNAYYALAGSNRTAEGQAAHLAQHRDELRDLFRKDLAAIVAAAGGK